MKTISGKVKAWITDIRSSSATFNKDSVEGSNYAYYSQDMTALGWTLAGTAEITIVLEDEDAILGNMVDALNAQKKSVQAKAQREITLIDERIQSLLALPAQVQS